MANGAYLEAHFLITRIVIALRPTKQINRMSTVSTKSTKCPAEELLKSLGGKWKVHILHLTEDMPKRFSDYMRLLEGANKQSVSVALKELEEDNYLSKVIVSERPLHIEYSLTERARLVIPVLEKLHQSLNSDL